VPNIDAKTSLATSPSADAGQASTPIDRIGRLLRPRAIAVVGASTDRSKLAGYIIPLLLGGGYKGRLFAVNPNRTEVSGVPSYPTLSAITEQIDHAVVIVRQEQVNDVLRECVAHGVAGASIFTSGYAEAGAEGAAEQAQLATFKSSVTFLGPNCMGFANLVDGIIATASPILARDSRVGDVAAVSQSGGLLFASIVAFASEAGLHFTYMVNTGNTAGIDYGDLLEFLYADAATRVVFLVAESDAVVAQVVRRVNDIALQKPTVLLKLGRGATGAAMARSHTGALAGDYGLVRDCAEGVGIVCVDDIDDALNAIQLLRAGFQTSDAHGVGALSISGGNVTLFADAVDQSRLTFAHLAAETETRLRDLLPSYITVHNPIDVTNLGFERPDVHRAVMEALLADPSVTCLVPVLTTVEDYRPVTDFIIELAAGSSKRFAVVWNGTSYDGQAFQDLIDAGIPVARGARTLVRALEAVSRARTDLKDLAREAFAMPRIGTSGQLLESAGLQLLADNGVPVAPWMKATADTVYAAATKIGYPVALKVDSAETHISDRGGVVLNLRKRAELAAAAAQLTKTADSFIVMRYVQGPELFASAFHHPEFGLVMVMGTGGRWVELLRDVRFVALPASRVAIAVRLSDTIIGQALTNQTRGLGGLEATVEGLYQLGCLAWDARDRVAQIEVNPFIVSDGLLLAVDAAIDIK
jgi:acyl-CoA synthetase (NDP forming)